MSNFLERLLSSSKEEKVRKGRVKKNHKRSWAKTEMTTDELEILDKVLSGKSSTHACLEKGIEFSYPAKYSLYVNRLAFRFLYNMRKKKDGYRNQ